MSRQYTKNQHYVPQMILKRFTVDENKIFELLVMENKIYQTAIDNSMSQRNFYEHKSLSRNYAENRFQDYENRLSRLIDNIHNGLDNYSVFNTEKLHDDIFTALPLYIVMYYRSYATVNEINFLNEKNNNAIFEILRNIDSPGYINDLTNTLRNFYNMVVFKSDGKFIISDQCISTCSLNVKSRFANLSNRQIGMKDILVLIPVSKNYYICFYHDSTDKIYYEKFIHNCDNTTLRTINYVICNNSYIKVAGANEDVLEEIRRKFNFSSPTQVLIGRKDDSVFGANVKKEVFLYDKDRELFDFFTSMMWGKYREIYPNDRCLCESGLKYKHCCKWKVAKAEIMMEEIANPEKQSYRISPYAIVEVPIAQFDTAFTHRPRLT